MDNLPAHKGARVEKLIKAAEVELRFLPPYSPDMNPIEKAFSEQKAYLRKIAERTVSALMTALETCADIFKTAECANYFAGCRKCKAADRNNNHNSRERTAPPDYRAAGRRSHRDRG